MTIGCMPSNSPSYLAPTQKNAREVRRIKISVFVMVLEDCPMGAINLLLILMGCTKKSEEGTETSSDREEEQPLDTLLVVSTVFSAILFGYKGNKVLGFGRIEREAKAAEFEISQIEKKVTAMLEVWEGGGPEEEVRRLAEVIAKKERENDQQKAEIDQKSAEIDQKSAEIDQQRAEIEQQRAETEQQRAQNDQQRSEIDQQRAEISTLRRRLVKKGEVDIGVDLGGSKEGCQSRDPEPASSEDKSKTN